MATLPATGYLADSARTEAEMQTALEAVRDFLSQIPASAETQLTISSGTITPATRGEGSVKVETEAAAASDDLANIAQTNVSDGSLLLLRAHDAAHTVVVKHAAGGAGQVFLQYNTDFSLDDTDKWLLLKRVSTNWEEVFRSWGNDPAGERSALGITAGAVPHLPIINGYIEWSIGANALVAAVKTLAGADPSAGDPVYAVFRDATLTTSGYYVRSITAALSVTASSGSTLGTVSGQASRIRAVLVDDGGTVVLGLYNPYNSSTKSLVGLNEGAVYSTTAEGGAGAADSAQVIYTTAAKTSKAIREVAYVDSTQATAGTWATALTNEVQITATTPKTGAVLQAVRSADGAVATGTTTLPNDDTIPQNTEGDQYMAQAITPQAAANLLHITHLGSYASSNGSVALMLAALFQDSTANALAAINQNRTGIAGGLCSLMLPHLMVAGTVSATTFKIRAGLSAAGTTTFNGAAGARIFGGVMASNLHIEEIMV